MIANRVSIDKLCSRPISKESDGLDFADIIGFTDFSDHTFSCIFIHWNLILEYSLTLHKNKCL